MLSSIVNKRTKKGSKVVEQLDFYPTKGSSYNSAIYTKKDRLNKKSSYASANNEDYGAISIKTDYYDGNRIDIDQLGTCYVKGVEDMLQYIPTNKIVADSQTGAFIRGTNKKDRALLLTTASVASSEKGFELAVKKKVAALKRQVKKEADEEIIDTDYIFNVVRERSNGTYKTKRYKGHFHGPRKELKVLEKTIREQNDRRKNVNRRLAYNRFRDDPKGYSLSPYCLGDYVDSKTGKKVLAGTLARNSIIRRRQLQYNKEKRDARNKLYSEAYKSRDMWYSILNDIKVKYVPYKSKSKLKCWIEKDKKGREVFCVNDPKAVTFHPDTLLPLQIQAFKAYSKIDNNGNLYTLLEDNNNLVEINIQIIDMPGMSYTYSYPEHLTGKIDGLSTSMYMKDIKNLQDFEECSTTSNKKKDKKSTRSKHTKEVSKHKQVEEVSSSIDSNCDSSSIDSNCDSGEYEGNSSNSDCDDDNVIHVKNKYGDIAVSKKVKPYINKEEVMKIVKKKLKHNPLNDDTYGYEIGDYHKQDNDKLLKYAKKKNARTREEKCADTLLRLYQSKKLPIINATYDKDNNSANFIVPYKRITTDIDTDDDTLLKLNVNSIATTRDLTHVVLPSVSNPAIISVINSMVAPDYNSIADKDLFNYDKYRTMYIGDSIRDCNVINTIKNMVDSNSIDHIRYAMSPLYSDSNEVITTITMHEAWHAARERSWAEVVKTVHKQYKMDPESIPDIERYTLENIPEYKKIDIKQYNELHFGNDRDRLIDTYVIPLPDYVYINRVYLEKTTSEKELEDMFENEDYNSLKFYNKHTGMMTHKGESLIYFNKDWNPLYPPLPSGNLYTEMQDSYVSYIHEIEEGFRKECMYSKGAWVDIVNIYEPIPEFIVKNVSQRVLNSLKILFLEIILQNISITKVVVGLYYPEPLHIKVWWNKWEIPERVCVSEPLLLSSGVEYKKPYTKEQTLRNIPNDINSISTYLTDLVDELDRSYPVARYMLDLAEYTDHKVQKKTKGKKTYGNHKKINKIHAKNADVYMKKNESVLKYLECPDLDKYKPIYMNVRGGKYHYVERFTSNINIEWNLNIAYHALNNVLLDSRTERNDPRMDLLFKFIVEYQLLLEEDRPDPNDVPRIMVGVNGNRNKIISEHNIYESHYDYATNQCLYESKENDLYTQYKNTFHILKSYNILDYVLEDTDHDSVDNEPYSYVGYNKSFTVDDLVQWYMTATLVDTDMELYPCEDNAKYYKELMCKENNPEDIEIGLEQLFTEQEREEFEQIYKRRDNRNLVLISKNYGITPINHSRKLCEKLISLVGKDEARYDESNILISISNVVTNEPDNVFNYIGDYMKYQVSNSQIKHNTGIVLEYYKAVKTRTVNNIIRNEIYTIYDIDKVKSLINTLVESNYKLFIPMTRKSLSQDAKEGQLTTLCESVLNSIYKSLPYKSVKKWYNKTEPNNDNISEIVTSHIIAYYSCISAHIMSIINSKLDRDIFSCNDFDRACIDYMYKNPYNDNGYKLPGKYSIDDFVDMITINTNDDTIIDKIDEYMNSIFSNRIELVDSAEFDDDYGVDYYSDAYTVSSGLDGDAYSDGEVLRECYEDDAHSCGEL